MLIPDDIADKCDLLVYAETRNLLHDELVYSSNIYKHMKYEQNNNQHFRFSQNACLHQVEWEKMEQYQQ